MDKEKRLVHISDHEMRQAMIRLLDLWEKAYRTGSIVVTSFFDPYSLQIGSDILRGLPELSFSVYGGYEGAERARFAIYPTWENRCDIDYRLSFLDVRGNFKFRSVSHRDFLGSLLALGLTRDKIGDILIHTNGCQVILDEDLTDYVSANWERVATVPIKILRIPSECLAVPLLKKKEIKATVASPRLDAVLGVGFGCSRSRILPDVKAGKVHVNWKTVMEPSFRVKEGDVISLAGKGRLQVASLTGPSSKGRFFIVLSEFISF